MYKTRSETGIASHAQCNDKNKKRMNHKKRRRADGRELDSYFFMRRAEQIRRMFNAGILRQGERDLRRCLSWKEQAMRAPHFTLASSMAWPDRMILELVSSSKGCGDAYGGGFWKTQSIEDRTCLGEAGVLASPGG